MKLFTGLFAYFCAVSILAVPITKRDLTLTVTIASNGSQHIQTDDKVAEIVVRTGTYYVVKGASERPEIVELTENLTENTSNLFINEEEPSLSATETETTTESSEEHTSEDVVDAADEHSSTLMEAVESCDLELVLLLLANFSDVNVRDTTGWTALHKASAWCDSQGVDIVETLLEHGADIDAEDIDGRTPLHQAASLGSEDIVRTLLDCGANASIKSHSGRTAADFAQAAGYTEIAEILRIAEHRVHTTTTEATTAAEAITTTDSDGIWNPI